MSAAFSLDHLPPECTTVEVAKALGLAVRSVQLMVDRGELEAWKTPGGHRRIARESVLQWARAQGHALSVPPSPPPPERMAAASRKKAVADAPRVLLIEDSVHYQNLIQMLIARRFPSLDLRLADDGISGLALFGQWQPDLLLVDIMLPGIDGAALITSLRSHPVFERCQLIVVTSLDDDQLAPYAYALDGVPVIRKHRLVLDLPAFIEKALAHRLRQP